MGHSVHPGRQRRVSGSSVETQMLQASGLRPGGGRPRTVLPDPAVYTEAWERLAYLAK